MMIISEVMDKYSPAGQPIEACNLLIDFLGMSNRTIEQEPSQIFQKLLLSRLVSDRSFTSYLLWGKGVMIKRRGGPLIMLEFQSTQRERERGAHTHTERMDDIMTVTTIDKASRFKRVCVFCGAYAGRRSVFQEKAIDLGNELVRRKLDLVYGGGSAGLMGTVARAVQEGGQHVLGVIPEVLMRSELTGLTVGEVKVVADMHERKAEMARLADAFIALPGGYGTLEELLEVITWAQLGIHDKPVGVLNVDGFYDFLLEHVDKSVQEGFIQPNGRHIVVAAPTAQELLTRLEEYKPRHTGVAPKHMWELEPGNTATNGSNGMKLSVI